MEDHRLRWTPVPMVRAAWWIGLRERRATAPPHHYAGLV
ncbi:MAG: hypothetical protein AVDCRST_MAG26-1482 [uncultured Chloroflexia bacterium]|uniref:Uncharacterized protein n=1 Tax=uncultured Chloroflexia bacterium TaxID=1672391 RepID=A0A6J4I4D5_9CHLR|nr:MAG: hypothetical protein AVDCRST_MAG26-1482 [uncultured Chloroflexia bacterium]